MLQINLTRLETVPEVSLKDEIQQITLDYQRRRTQREQRLSSIKMQIDQRHTTRKRTKQSIPLYFLSLALPITLSFTNAYMILEINTNAALKGILVVVIICLGFILSLLSNLTLGPWKQIIKLYFIVDSLLPVMIAALISLYTLENTLSGLTGTFSAARTDTQAGKGPGSGAGTGAGAGAGPGLGPEAWYTQAYSIVLPLWILYFSANTRIIIAYIEMTKCKVILYKLAVLISGLIFFYVGYTFMQGAYKITGGRDPITQDRIKNVVLLYVFGMCQLFFSFYRKLSEFDQTEKLKYDYQFQDTSQQEQREIHEVEYQQLQKQAIKEQRSDAILVEAFKKRSQMKIP